MLANCSSRITQVESHINELEDKIHSSTEVKKEWRDKTERKFKVHKEKIQEK